MTSRRKIDLLIWPRTNIACISNNFRQLFCFCHRLRLYVFASTLCGLLNVVCACVWVNFFSLSRLPHFYHIFINICERKYATPHRIMNVIRVQRNFSLISSETLLNMRRMLSVSEAMIRFHAIHIYE